MNEAITVLLVILAGYFGYAIVNLKSANNKINEHVKRESDKQDI